MAKVARPITRVFCRCCRRLVLRERARLQSELPDGTEFWICCRCDGRAEDE
jgi:hypothetical protein